MQYSDFSFTLTIANAGSTPCTVTAPTVANQAYQINDPLATFTVPAFTVGAGCGAVTYTNTVPAGASFIGGNSGSGKTFTWQTSSFAFAGTYTIKVQANHDSTFTEV